MEILEEDTMKQAIKEKIKKNTPGERENYSKPDYIAEISSKGYTPGCCILLIDPTKNIIKDNERTSMNETKHTSL